MGGLIARSIATDIPNVKGAFFIASPLKGDVRIELKVKRDQETLLAGLTPFIDQLGALPDYMEHFWDSGFKPSIVSNDIF